MSHPASFRRLSTLGLAVSAALVAMLVAACGGGGSQNDDSSSNSSSSGSTTQAEAQSASSTSLSGGQSVSSSVDVTYRTTLQLVSASKSLATSKSSAAAAASTGDTSDTSDTTDATDVVTFEVPCESSGIATVKISGGTEDTLLNGELDAGEHYEVSFSACSIEQGVVQLDGGVAMDVESVSTDAPANATVAMTFSGLTVSVKDQATTQLDGTVKLEHTETASDSTTVATSHITSSEISLSTVWNEHSVSLSLTSVDVTHTVTWADDVLSSSTLQGQYEVSGTANSRNFEDSVSIGSEVAFDTGGKLKSGSWTSVDSKRTVTSTAADGSVTLQVDDGSDGTTDRTWTVTVPQWLASAG